MDLIYFFDMRFDAKEAQFCSILQE